MFERFLFLARIHAPFEIRCKEDSWLMRFLGFFVRIFNKKFAQYTTTCMNTIYLPGTLYNNLNKRLIPLIAHEVVHIRDRGRLTPPLYVFLYLFPQILFLLSLLSLLAIWFSNWWLLSLLALGLLSPIPAPGRVYLEKRGYLMSLAAIHWMYNDWEFTKNLIPRYVKQFTGHSYYFMGVGQEYMLITWFLSELNLIRANVYPDQFFKAVHVFIKEEKENG